ncbi:dihydrolipoamide acetyltransferase family protein [Piscibacillus halophilus]|uniref:Dihydrolipoamide acetyltransferase component of pyruvate dehydrogenase complex n=1 Tax=Piscibacillus halophilus TaxID=571933 RepID=A0A1H9JQD2_9BACI|nr:dihydrolipoamide acetyltransferase family protein [Piscibacillus halophilus]SEQ89008.1 pyruvate dehydrogenase E2 component (dihydrolipoamide acetyltransferase) [Piscibacillus halophilus]
MIEVKLHDIGEGMTEGEIVHYYVKEGDMVKTDQPLVEVQTDKMVAELPSPGTGQIKEILIPIGETVQVGTTLLLIEGEGADKSHREDQPEEQPAQTVTKELTNKRITTKVNRVLATPYTRKIARDHGIDIEQVPASDPSGRVTEEDIYQYINQSHEPVIEETLEVEPPQSNSDEIPFRGIRKQIAQKMTQSLYTIPHVTHFDEVELTRLMELREELKADGISVSVPAFFMKALVFALKGFPVFNAELDETQETIKLKKEYNIGLATDTEDGLMVPVIHGADRKSIQQLHKDIKDLTQKAKERKLEPKHMKNGTFTMSNVGPLGSTGATPIINYPETALIAFHKTKKRPVINDQDEIVIGQMMNLSMSFDHRVADGATAVAFTNRFISLIENPSKLMLEMI